MLRNYPGRGPKHPSRYSRFSGHLRCSLPVLISLGKCPSRVQEAAEAVPKAAGVMGWWKTVWQRLCCASSGQRGREVSGLCYLLLQSSRLKHSYSACWRRDREEEGVRMCIAIFTPACQSREEQENLFFPFPKTSQLFNTVGSCNLQASARSEEFHSSQGCAEVRPLFLAACAEVRGGRSGFRAVPFGSRSSDRRRFPRLRLRLPSAMSDVWVGFRFGFLFPSYLY